MSSISKIDKNLPMRLRIEALIADYSHCIDEDQLENWPNFFTEDAQYRVFTRENYDLKLPVALIYCDGRGMLKDRISALRTANIFEPHVYCHMTSAIKFLENENDVQRIKSNFTVIRTMSEGDMTIFACGKTFDTIVEIDGMLKFKKRDIILDSRRVDTLLVVPI